MNGCLNRENIHFVGGIIFPLTINAPHGVVCWAAALEIVFYLAIMKTNQQYGDISITLL